MQNTTDVLFEEMPGNNGNLGLITLNRPKVLNALNHEMFLAMEAKLIEWEDNSRIKAVVIQAVEGRAFCAGGDIRHAYELHKTNDPNLLNFFGDEYRLNKLIYYYSKPYIALMDGMVMGGGVGVSLHGSHRVGTDKLVFAMPETNIGFYPDVGASYFLPRLPGKFGMYLGLTGERIPYNDCFEFEIATHIVMRESFADILNKLATTSLEENTDATVSDILNQFIIPVPKSSLVDHSVEIDMCFSKTTMESLFQALEEYPSVWCENVYNILSLKSPTSLKVTLRQLLAGSKLDFDACMALELNLTSQFLEGHDLYEGIRAAIIDKDQTPHWDPAKLEDVTGEMVDSYFAPLLK